MSVKVDLVIRISDIEKVCTLDLERRSCIQMLDGCIARICVSNDMQEVYERYFYAVHWLSTLLRIADCEISNGGRKNA